MLIKEFRIPLPLSVEEYKVGQLFSVAKESLNETGGGEGVTVNRNEPFNNLVLGNGPPKNGQYTLKMYHIKSKVPRIVSMLLPNEAMEIQEEAWNAFPYCRTILTNPGYMKKNFTIVIESMHINNDRGEQENVFNLNEEQLSKREVTRIDIANDRIPRSDYHEETDPAKFHSTKTGRGPLQETWIRDVQPPFMTCYKIVYVEFKFLGFQTQIEKLIMKSQQRLFTAFHRHLFCWMDAWIGMNMQDVRDYEERIAAELASAITTGTVRGAEPDNSE